MICAGIDAGSRMVKAVILDGVSGKILGHAVADQGLSQVALARRVLRMAAADAGMKNARGIGRIVATGYGRHNTGLRGRAVTEITCHATGAHRLVPGVRTVIDIGGQDSKVIRLAADGTVRDFVMNDRCAAGTGRFMEVVAERCGFSLLDRKAIGKPPARPAVINCTCVVFAETEIIGLMAGGEKRGSIFSGVQNAVARRVASAAARIIMPPVVLTGGVALIPGMARAMSNAVGHRVRVAPLPQFAGALGAALLAAEGDPG